MALNVAGSSSSHGYTRDHAAQAEGRVTPCQMLPSCTCSMHHIFGSTARKGFDLSGEVDVEWVYISGVTASMENVFLRIPNSISSAKEFLENASSELPSTCCIGPARLRDDCLPSQ